MFAYIVRRVLYAIPILIGVNAITFVLFFIVNTPDQMARMHLGMKHVTPEAVERWKQNHGYNKPLFYNAGSDKGALVDTIFFDKSVKLFAFDFGNADDGRNITEDIKQRMWPSLAIAIPVFVVGLLVTISFALLIAFFRASYIDYGGVVLCVVLMSISSMFYIIGGQYLISKLLHLVPISGYDDSGVIGVKFLILPVIIGVIGGIGAGTRWYRTIFLEEINRDYVRTARAKGLSERLVLFRHVLRNAMIPILTAVVSTIPLLFMGSLITESFFGIPGLGSYTIDAIQQQDFAIVRSMVFLGSVLYIIGLLLTDISYTIADPRVRLN